MTSLESTSNILTYADMVRQEMHNKLAKKEKFRQYFSSAPVASLMASMMDYNRKTIRILDPGAGVGSLFAACMQCIFDGDYKPDSVEIVAYEIDHTLIDSIEDTMQLAGRTCRDMGVKFSSDVVERDFIRDYAASSNILTKGFTHVIVNPPYEKINTASKTYGLLDGIGLPAKNMYSAFIAISYNLLSSEGQMTFISPRSFCNGSYFEQFRKDFLNATNLKRIHLFGSRTTAFQDDGVLQENVIISAEKHGTNQNMIISSSNAAADNMIQRRVGRSDVIHDTDPHMFIHIVPDVTGARISERLRYLDCTLEELGISISTGRVVDFRAREELRHIDEPGAVPLVRPFNISDGTMKFPIRHKKHHIFIMANGSTKKLLVENGNYVLVKRFTAVEQKKRITAAIWTRDMYDANLVGFENRINYFHQGGMPLAGDVARGLWVFLNCTMVDTYFRQFSGSTQINASDLRYLRYPSEKQLVKLGHSTVPGMGQAEIDRLVDELLPC